MKIAVFFIARDVIIVSEKECISKIFKFYEHNLEEYSAKQICEIFIFEKPIFAPTLHFPKYSELFRLK